MNRAELLKDETGAYVYRDLLWAPTDWQLRGLQETATGYGSRLNSGYKIQYAGKLRRVYAVCYSNCSSFYVIVKGEKRFLGI